MKKYCLILFGFLVFNFCQGQIKQQWNKISVEDILPVIEKTGKWFAVNNSYQVRIKYESYKSYDDKVPEDAYDGFVKRKGAAFESLSMGIRTIQNEKLNLSIDSVNQLIVLNKPRKIESPQNYLTKEILRKCKSIYQNVSNNDSLFRMEFTNGEYNSVEVSIVDGKYKNIKLFLNREIPLDRENKNSAKSKPRIEITFSNYSTKPELLPNELSERKYIRISENKITASNDYSNYRIRDLRIKP